LLGAGLVEARVKAGSTRGRGKGGGLLSLSLFGEEGVKPEYFVFNGEIIPNPTSQALLS
jgi:hypothetical protein